MKKNSARLVAQFLALTGIALCGSRSKKWVAEVDRTLKETENLIDSRYIKDFRGITEAMKRLVLKKPMTDWVKKRHIEAAKKIFLWVKASR